MHSCTPISLRFRVVCLLPACLVAVTLNPAAGWAQIICSEPQDDAYVERMELLRQAIRTESYEEALRHSQRAWEQYQYPVLEFTSARALHHLERYQEAIDAYSQFLTDFEGCPDPDGIATTARDYRALAIQQQSEVLTGMVEETDEDEGGINPGWFVMSGGLAILTAGLVYDLANLHLRSDKEAADRDGDHNAFYRIQSEIEDAQTVEWILFGTGAAAAVTGLVLLLLDSKGPGDDAEVVSLSVTNGGAMLTFAGGF